MLGFRQLGSALVLVAVLTAFGALSACNDDPTGLVVEVTSPLGVPADVNQLEFFITGETSGAMVERRYAIDGAWPHSLAIVPGDDDDESLVITVVGRRVLAGEEIGAFVVRRVVRAAFVAGQTRTVPVVLYAECTGIECPAGVDCELGRCVDGSGVDAGPRDGGFDGGTMDGAMPDGDVPDAMAECTTDTDCDDGVDCIVDRCAAGRCTHAPDDTLCAMGEICQLTGCGAPCVTEMDCDDALPCNGAERCMDGRCIAGMPIVCDDGIACTSDACDDTTGTCAYTPDAAMCSDRNACNGAETCDAEFGCVPGTALDCNDGNDCSVDSCDMAVGCVYRTRDADADGHGDILCPATGGVPADDCDDASGDAFPGAPELCNGADDDCDGSPDDAYACAAGSSGTCTTSCGTAGSRVCSATCSWSVCTPPAEVCNGRDDDCNGACDDGFACCQGTSQACTTSCGSTGTRACDATCSLGACVPPAETCGNMLDDDCDGYVDDGCGTRCSTDADCNDGNACNGVETCFMMGCRPGTAITCDDGQRCTVDTCNPATGCVYTPDNRFCDDGVFCNGAERCDAVMGCRPGTAPTCNDSNACTEDSCGGTSPGMCINTTRDADDDGHGDRTCTAAGGIPADDCDDTRASVYPGAPELCNGRDDDCDTACDDGFACCMGSTGTCMTSCGTTGSRVCSTTCAWSVCTPPAETCNGRDDDCNGACDDGFACCRGSSGSCTTTCGSTGTRTCSNSCAWGTCTPPVEICNGRDDDCDSIVDDGFTCAAGATRACTTTCGSPGMQTCTSSCGWGVCVPPGEVCNGMDDDCDGAVDNGFTCAAGSTGTCLASCGTVGSRTCSATCSWNACTPPAEVCNGTDDDCDGLPDDGFTCAAGSTGSCTTSCMSTGTRTCSAMCGWGSCTPPAEMCNGRDDDCDTMVDEGCGSCTDMLRNGTETDVDCGGPNSCPRCANGRMCTTGTDCLSTLCSAGRCVSCTDGLRNGSETDVDCGGPLCPRCADTRMCSVGTDCISGVCSAGRCAVPSCTDGVRNGTETDVDCGSGCPGCANGRMCILPMDCQSGVCTGGRCAVPSCTDGVRNGTESDIDCGGSCTRCPDGRRCNVASDCVAGVCTGGYCGDCMPFGSDGFGYVGCRRSVPTPPCPSIAQMRNRVSLTDDSHVFVPIGFTFNFYGTNYTMASVDSNGVIAFEDVWFTYSNTCMPYVGPPVRFIAPFWDDLNPSSTPGDVYIEIQGTAPNRTFNVQWVLQHFSTTPETIDVRAVLHEGTNKITFCYVDTTFGVVGFENGEQATSGIQGSDVNFIQHSCNTATLTPGMVVEFRRP